MKIRTPFSWFLATLLAVVSPLALRAVDIEPFTLPVSFSFRINGVGNGIMTVYGEGSSPSVGQTTYNANTESDAQSAKLAPGKAYTLNFQASGPSEYWLSLVAPSGYQFYINGQPQDLYYRYVGGGGYSHDYSIELRPASGEPVIDGATFLGIDLGQAVSWELGMGASRGGHSVGRLGFRERDLTNSPAARERLYYTPPINSTQVNVIRDGSSNQRIRQIAAQHKILDFVDDGASAYNINFYDHDDMTWTGSIYTINSGKTPWKVIRVESPGTSQLKITETEGSVSRISHLSLTSGSVSSGTYVWTLQEGGPSNNWLRTTTHTSTVSGGTRENAVAVRTGGTGGTIVSETKYVYSTYAWGEDLYQVIANPNGGIGNTLTTTYTYHETAPSSGNETYRGSYGRVKSVTDPMGGWTAYAYYDEWNGRGQTKYQYQPFQNSPASVSLDPALGRVKYSEYVADTTGRFRRPSLVQEKIGNVITGKTVWTYDNSTNSGLPRIKADVDAYSTSTAYLRTHTEVIDPISADVDESGEPYVVKNPDLTQVSWSRSSGDYSYSPNYTFTVNATTGQQWRVLKLNGTTSSSGAEAQSSYDSQSFESIYLIPYKSTMEVTILRFTGKPLHTETRVYTGGGTWSPAFGTVESSYDAHGRLTSQTSLPTGATTTYTYANGFLTSTTGADGVQNDFTYDALGRTATVKKVGAAASGSYAAQVDITTTSTYDGANRVTTQVVGNSGNGETITSSAAYDLAGRVTSQTPPGLSATTTAYNASARTVTSTAPHGGTTISTAQLDGRTASLTGTAVVAQTYTYGIESDGRRYTYVDIGSSIRRAKSWTDWLGRPTEARSPGFSITSQVDSVTKHFYETGTGNHIKTTRTDPSSNRLYADTLYVYNTLGQMTRSGLDIDNGGSLVLASMDRITDADAIFESYSSAWWLKQTSTLYPLANSATAFTSSLVRTRLTGFSGSLRGETQATDAEGNVATSTTTASGKTVTTTTTAPGMVNSSVSVAYNGLAVGTTGFDGLVTLAQYDPLGRPWKSTDPRGLVTTTAYYSNTALPYTVTDSASNVVSTTAYDTTGRVSSAADALGAVTRYAYNTRGAVIRQWGTGTYPVEYEYDSTYGDRTKMRTWRTSPIDFTDATAFLPANYTYPATTGDATTWTMDAATALLHQKTDATGKVVEFDYNARGQTASRKWSRTLTSSSTKVTTSYTYDGATGEQLTITYNDSGEAIPTPSVTYTYSRSGQVATVADGAGTRTFAYQAAAPWRLDYEDLPSFFDSRRITRLYETSSGTGGTFGSHTIGTVKGRAVGFELGISSDADRDLHQNYTVSSLGRMVGVSSKIGTGTTQDFIYSYQSSSSLLSGYTTGANFSVARTYESNRDLLASIDSKWGTGTNSTLTRFDFTHNALYQRVTANQTGTAYADYYSGTGYSSVYNVYNYNTRGELQTAAMYRGDTPSATPSSTDELPGRRFEYRFDNIGNRLTAGATGSAGSADDEYTSNALNQYTAKENNFVRFFGTKKGNATVAVPGVTVGVKDRAWAADFVPSNASAAANGTASIYSALVGGGSGGLDLIGIASKPWFIPQAAQPLTYDDDGNITGDGVFTFTWNAENQLVRAASALPTGSGFTRPRIDFKYDYTGRRIEKRVTNLDTSTETLARRFTYDGWNLIAELNANTPSTLIRTYTWGLDLVGELTKSGGVGAMLQLYDYAATKTYWPTYDGNGNVASLVNASTGAIASAYEYDPFGNYIRNEVMDSVVTDNPFRFSTKYTDAETGWANFGYRYYSPSLGRFINRDTIEETGGINLYAFVGNDGVNGWDYLGMVAQDQYITAPGDDETDTIVIMGNRGDFGGMMDGLNSMRSFGGPILSGKEAMDAYKRELAATDHGGSGLLDGLFSNRPVVVTGPTIELEKMVIESGGRGSDSARPPPTARNPISRLLNGLLDIAQTVIGVAGMVPAIGEVADLANAGISGLRYLATGNIQYRNDAGFSLAAAIPIAGWAAGAVRIARGAENVAGAVMAVKRGETAATQAGRAAHKELAEKVKQKSGWKSEPRLTDPQTGKTVIPDAVTPTGKPVELKPNTDSGRAQGQRQLPKYERATGKSGKVIYYNPPKSK